MSYQNRQSFCPYRLSGYWHGRRGVWSTHHPWRPFLSTVKAIIYIGTVKVHMHFPSEKVRRYFTDPNYIIEDSKQVRTRRRWRNRNQRRQIIKDGWADYEGEVVRSEDIQLEQNYPVGTVAPSQVWREKIVIHKEKAPVEAPTTPSNESQDD